MGGGNSRDHRRSRRAKAEKPSESANHGSDSEQKMSTETLSPSNESGQSIAHSERGQSKDIFLAALAMIIGYLAIQYGQHWLKWGGAVLFWYAAFDYTKQKRKVVRWIVNVTAAVALFFGAFALGKDRINHANVSLLSINAFPYTSTPFEIVCKNDSDYPANEELCWTRVYFEPTTDGSITSDVQERDFAAAETALQLNYPKMAAKTLEPHQERMSTGNTLNVPPQLWRAFADRQGTFLFAGIITWKDEAGGHRAEFCKWKLFVTPSELQMKQNLFRLCKDHNRIVF